MAQLISVRLSRDGSVPWGFRLQGGKDFGTPLVIQKVNGGSPAEKAGLKAGDAVIKVNNTDVFNLRHKDAQDTIVSAGPSFEVTVQRGGSTWKPQVTAQGNVAAPKSAPLPSYITPVTKTSLAAKPQDPLHIGSGHNNQPKGFSSNLNGTTNDNLKNLVNKQFNSPIGIYSEQNIAETLSAQAEVLAGGVLGVNFKKNEKTYDATNSEVFKMLQESGNEPEQEEPSAPIQPAVSGHVAPSHVAPTQSGVSGLRHVTAPVTAPPSSTPLPGGLPPGQNICADCERLIVGVFVRIKEKNLHVECFKCATCGSSLKNQGYYSINNKLYCDIHAKLAAIQRPPPGTEGCVPVPMPPGGKLPVSAITAALSNHSLNGGCAPPKATPSVASPYNLSNIRDVSCNKINNNCQYNNNVDNKSACSDKSSTAGSDVMTDDEVTCDDKRPTRHISEIVINVNIGGSDINGHCDTRRCDKPTYSVCENNNRLVDVHDGFNDGEGFRKDDVTRNSVIRKVLPPNKGGVYKVSGNLSGPKPYGFNSVAAPLSAVSAPTSAVPAPSYSAPLSPLSPQSYPPPPVFTPGHQQSATLPRAATQLPGTGGKSGSGTFGVASAPKRGRGILNKAVGPGTRVPLCGYCNSHVRGPFITALGRIWCPDHFVCVNATCKRPLQDIGFVEERGQLYCEYCFEQFIAPPCDKCHGKIKGDCLNAIGKHFHPECFTCCYCGKLFGNNPFFLEEGQAYCEADWNELFTTKCFACGFPVEAGDRWVEALSNNYHSQCFNCTMCKKNLEGQSFYAKGGRPFCKNHAR